MRGRSERWPPRARYEMKASIAVVATRTLATGRADCIKEGPLGVDDIALEVHRGFQVHQVTRKSINES